MYRRFLPLLLLFFSAYAYGVSILDTPLKNEQQRQIFEQLQKIDTTIPSSTIEKTDTNQSQITPDITCYQTKKIDVHHAKNLNESMVLSITNHYLGKCNGIRSLNGIAKELTRLYVDQGYITSRVYLTPQYISDGIVDLYALEGQIEMITSDNSKTDGAFTGLNWEILNLIDLESSLEQVNRLRSNTTTMDILPGQAQGGSVVVLNSRETFPLFGSFGINNYGSEGTGKLQISGGFTWENPLGLSDSIAINFNTTDKQQTGKKSFGNSYTYSIPWGRWLWETGFSRFTYDQTIYGLNDSFISHGESEVTSLGTAYKLHHTRDYSIELNSQIAQKKNKSFIEGALIDASTYNLSVGNLGFKYVYRQSSWELYTLLNYYQGMSLFDPTTNGTLKHDFSKWTLSLGATKYFDATLPISYQFSSYVQYSDDLLYSVEQVGIGGSYSVRGFQKQGLSGNSGGYVRNELTFQMDPYFIPYIAYDIGYVHSGVDVLGGTLSSGTVGFRSRYGSFLLDVYHAIPFTSPNNTFDADPFVGITLSTNF